MDELAKRSNLPLRGLTPLDLAKQFFGEKVVSASSGNRSAQFELSRAAVAFEAAWYGCLATYW